MPSREAIRRFVREAPGRVGKREIAREFGLDLRPALGAARPAEGHGRAEGELAPAGRRRVAAPGRLPDAMVVQVTGTDPDGDAIARPVGWEGDGPPPLVLMAPEPRGRPALAPGERVLARLTPIGGGKYEGRTLKRLTDAPGRVLGVFHPAPRRRRPHRAHRPPLQGRMDGAARRGRRAPKPARSCWPHPCPPPATA